MRREKWCSSGTDIGAFVVEITESNGVMSFRGDIYAYAGKATTLLASVADVISSGGMRTQLYLENGSAEIGQNATKGSLHSTTQEEK